MSMHRFCWILNPPAKTVTVWELLYLKIFHFCIGFSHVSPNDMSVNNSNNNQFSEKSQDPAAFGKQQDFWIIRYIDTIESLKQMARESLPFKVPSWPDSNKKINKMDIYSLVTGKISQVFIDLTIQVHILKLAR